MDRRPKRTARILNAGEQDFELDSASYGDIIYHLRIFLAGIQADTVRATMKMMGYKPPQQHETPEMS